MADATTGFADRHIGPRAADLDRMLDIVGVPSVDALISEAIPAGIRLAEALDLPDAESEAAFLARMRALAARNEQWRSFVGLGYYGCVTPPVILRNLLENPGWYTPYTPYQAEVAQGRLEALLNFQTAVADLTGMEVANASLLDEATAAAEAMTMLFRLQARQRPDARRFLVSSDCYPQTIEVVRGRAEPLGIRIDVADVGAVAAADAEWDELLGVLVQSPDASGRLHDLGPVTAWAHAAARWNTPGSIQGPSTRTASMTVVSVAAPGPERPRACVRRDSTSGVIRVRSVRSEGALGFDRMAATP